MVALSIVISLLPGFAWLVFYLQEDLHPEPKSLLLKTFVLGGIFAFFALALEIIFNTSFRYWGIGALSVTALLCFAFIEEILKFAAAYVSIHDDPAFDEPVDAMIYMIVAALGFATVENIGAIHMGGPAQTGFLNIVFETATLRFVGATLLHTLSSGLLGYYWALSISRFKHSKRVTQGILVATILHAVFNYLIINYGDIIYSVIFVSIVGFFVLNDFEKLKAKTV